VDFTYKYTDRQQRFRSEVQTWLEANLPDEVQDSSGQPVLDQTSWGLCAALREKLGAKDWLASQEPLERVGEGLDPADATVLFEELDARGLGWLLEETAGALRAIARCDAQGDRESLATAIANGRIGCWRSQIDSIDDLDPGDWGIQVTRDADDRILDGEGIFQGREPAPGYLWTLAVHDPEGHPEQAFSAFLIPPHLDGISIHPVRRISPDPAHRICFDQVRVPPHCLVGQEKDGWDLARSTFLIPSATADTPVQDQPLDNLLDHARTTTVQGVSIDAEPVRQQLLMEAYINRGIQRLFRMRDTWMRSTGTALTYHAAQTRLWEQRSALRLSEITREVMGVYALLDHRDPRAPNNGSLELQQRLALTNISASGNDSKIIARALGLASQEPERVGISAG
jgi:alkylation response protein AidB-like acyl-CoA dehydrogenase